MEWNGMEFWFYMQTLTENLQTTCASLFKTFVFVLTPSECAIPIKQNFWHGAVVDHRSHVALSLLHLVQAFRMHKVHCFRGVYH